MTNIPDRSSLPSSLPWQMKTSRAFLLRHSTISIFVIILCVAAALGTWIQFESAKKQLRANLLEQADRRAIQLSDAVSEQFIWLLRNTDLTLRELGEAWLADKDDFNVAPRSLDIRFPDQALMYLAVTGPDGNVVYSTRGSSDEDEAVHFEAVQRNVEQRTDSLQIGAPVYSNVMQQWSIPVSRPVLKDGEFLGLLIAGLSPKYISAMLARVNISEHDIIVFLDRHGAFLARSTEWEKALGKTVKKSRPFLAKDASVNGVFRAPATLDAIPRIFGWTILREYGVITVVGLDERYLLAPHAQQYAQDQLHSVTITLVVIFLGSGIWLLLLRLSRQQEALRKSRASLQEAQRIARIGNWSLDVKSNRLTWSEEIYRIFGTAPQTFAATYEAFLEAVHPEDRDKVNEQYQAAVETGLPYEIEHRIIRQDDGSVRWVHERCEHVRNARGEVIRSSGTVQDITERKQIEYELRKLATTDFLTGLPSRRSFINRLEDELARFHRAMGQPVTVAIIDLDHFKQINDSYGHTAGDEVLQYFSAMVTDELRRIDMAGRLGGEEFGVVLPGTNIDDAKHFAERLRKRVADSPLRLNDRQIPLSISIGVTEIRRDDKDPADIFERADKALYRAKDRGRNKVEVYKSD